MVMEEIYLLTKHAKFSAEYLEKIPVYKRRFYLNMLKEELDEQKKAHDKAMSKTKHTVSRSRKR